MLKNGDLGTFGSQPTAGETCDLHRRLATLGFPGSRAGAMLSELGLVNGAVTVARSDRLADAVVLHASGTVAGRVVRATRPLFRFELEQHPFPAIEAALTALRDRLKTEIARLPGARA